jgi:Zn-dependent protease with chaperone function
VKRFGAAIGGALLAAVTIPAAAQVAPLPPPYVGAYQPQGVDEIGWWREDDEAERELAASPLVIRDEKLNAYIKRVLCSTVGEDRCRAVRMYIMREPTFGATMVPNGTMRVFSGLLLRMRSEAELGAVLGHEFGHYEQRHGLKRFKATRSATDVLAWGALLASMAPTYDVRRSYSDLRFSIYGNLFLYSRDNEREADRLGIGYLNNSSLRPHAASEVWQNVMGEIEASARVKGLKKPNFNSIAFTASHPPHAERAATMAALADPAASSRGDGAESYREAMAPWLPIFLEDQIKLNDFGASEYLIQSLAEGGWTAPLWFARGELYRLRGHPRDLVNAAEFYQSAIQLDPALAGAHRGLGLSLLKTARPSDGQAALRKYLELKPEASDAGMIRLMLPKEGTPN